MKDVYNELIAALKKNNINSYDACKIADVLNDTHEDLCQEYNFTELLQTVKKAIQQTLINCKS